MRARKRKQEQRQKQYAQGLQMVSFPLPRNVVKAVRDLAGSKTLNDHLVQIIEQHVARAAVGVSAPAEIVVVDEKTAALVRLHWGRVKELLPLIPALTSPLSQPVRVGGRQYAFEDMREPAQLYAIMKERAKKMGAQDVHAFLDKVAALPR